MKKEKGGKCKVCVCVRRKKKFPLLTAGFSCSSHRESKNVVMTCEEKIVKFN